MNRLHFPRFNFSDFILKHKLILLFVGRVAIVESIHKPAFNEFYSYYLVQLIHVDFSFNSVGSAVFMNRLHSP